MSVDFPRDLRPKQETVEETTAGWLRQYGAPGSAGRAQWLHLGSCFFKLRVPGQQVWMQAS